MRVEEGVANELAARGLVAPAAVGAVAAAVKRVVEPGFVPGGATVRRVDMLIEQAKNPAAFARLGGLRCCAQTGEDIQSGPTYCGQPATVAGIVARDGLWTVGTCDDHAHILRALLVKPESLTK
jgi:hypothetical protein